MTSQSDPSDQLLGWGIEGDCDRFAVPAKRPQRERRHFAQGKAKLHSLTDGPQRATTDSAAGCPPPTRPHAHQALASTRGRPHSPTTSNKQRRRRKDKRVSRAHVEESLKNGAIHRASRPTARPIEVKQTTSEGGLRKRDMPRGGLPHGPTLSQTKWQRKHSTRGKTHPKATRCISVRDS